MGSTTTTIPTPGSVRQELVNFFVASFWGEEERLRQQMLTKFRMVSSISCCELVVFLPPNTLKSEFLLIEVHFFGSK